MNQPDLPAATPTPEFRQLLAGLSRRDVLRGGLGAAAGFLVSGPATAGIAASSSVPFGPKLDFPAVPRHRKDELEWPRELYDCSVLLRLGDPLTDKVAAFKNDGSDSDFGQRAGDHHDGMEFFGLDAEGRADATASDRGILALNHENITQLFLHPKGATVTEGVRPADEVDKEMAAHGVSFVEVVRKGGRFTCSTGSTRNRRVTPDTPVQLGKPLAGHALVKTRHAPAGDKARGTLNNCAVGRTPWGTFLTCEENWSFYFALSKDDYARRSAKEVAALARYGMQEGWPGRFENQLLAWSSVRGGSDRHARWDASVKGASAGDDFRNEPNTFGYVVEMDPYQPAERIVKRARLGRFAHENAACSKAVHGSRLAFYLGDDARNEYLYKYVPAQPWDEADRKGGMAAGDKYLDEGTLYVARFNADGTGQWLELSMKSRAVATFPYYRFADDADVLVHARIAADAVRATRLDRPEWCAVNPSTGDVYLTLTNNSERPLDEVDAANPRSYERKYETGLPKAGNVNGHVIRLAEDGGKAEALTFRWDVYLFGGEAADARTLNLSQLDDSNDLSSPDGLWFAPNGVLWVQTDDDAYRATNCMMLAALPGRVGDGEQVRVTSTRGDASRTVTSWKGRNQTPDTLRRFLVGPMQCEITGICQTPDGRAMFVNIQHPGEKTAAADIGDPAKWTSHWPDGKGRPRSATVVITRKDGGPICG